MRLFPPTLTFYLFNPATFLVLFALILSVVMCGCGDNEEVARDIVQGIRCVWSHRYKQCFCVGTQGYRGYMAWAPADVCKDEG